MDPPVPAAVVTATAADKVTTDPAPANPRNRQTADAQSLTGERQEQQQQQATNDEQQQPASSENNSTVAEAAAAVAAAAAAADETALQNQKLVEEFQYLLEKSQSLFSGLRDLPPTGSHRQWRPYFEKTFEVYTKLWKFQQMHRPILEDKNNYGLKRWEVGEIASKIGQLYYHYYLRTSDTSYLHEAYVFYDAIHERQYFKDILEVKNPALMIKKMRYYARFIVVSLLMNKDENIRILISELEGLVDEYTRSFKPPDAKEWHVVLNEINTFMEAEKKLAPVSSTDRTPVTAVHRLAPPPPGDKPITGGRQLRLQEAILVGNCSRQIKFSELTLDMYRILLSLELQFSVQEATPVMAKEESTATSKSATSSGTPKSVSAAAAAATTATTPAASAHRQRPNPHKYLLYRPSLSQLLVYLSTAFKDATDHGVVLLYLSADGCEFPHLKENGYNIGGVTMSQRKPTTASASTTSTSNAPPPEQAPASPTAAAVASSTQTYTHSPTALGSGVTAAATASMLPAVTVAPPIPASAAHVLYPADLTPYTRKPLFLIVDSTHSTTFSQLSSVFEQPLMCLMSPTEYPSSVQDKSEIGSLFTLFLHTPLLGFCSVSDIGNLDQEKWNECVDLISKMESRIGEILLEDPYVDAHVKLFMTDEFLWAFIVRFTLCSVILRCHTSFKEEKMFPTCTPALPEAIYRSPDIIGMLHELTLTAEVSTYFHLPVEEPAS